ncbi:ABC transporter ABCE [Kipferlia bialata]|uniref:ABC transporter ABCE n=1 Tax=Kipferlia bialata TaxID=797122 RepID=A0A9K3CMG8_9EUKA|nr:ABC transporter ABCE [Kipferlia bialata]|eukprot:g402.t1
MARSKTVKDEGTTRIAFVNPDRCRPKKCQLECKVYCPVNRMGKRCIEVKSTSKNTRISESLCNGCGICIKKCPFKAIDIINLPKALDSVTAHRYGPNAFKLHRLPIPRPGQVLGLVGINGIGKTTALNILAGTVKPNLGRFTDQPGWDEILRFYRGSELQNYFQALLNGEVTAIRKIQYVDSVQAAVKGKVAKHLAKKNQNGRMEELIDSLELRHLLDRKLSQLSGGELQRFMLCFVAIQEASVFMIDEPSSYLDVKQRLVAGRVIRSLVERGESDKDRYCICVEHDLAILDYLSDYVCCLYGVPGAYGVVSAPFSVREGINIFLAGVIPTENMRFREHAISFKISEVEDEETDKRKMRRYSYPAMSCKRGDFTLHVESGEFTDSEIVVLLGENGVGKTTFIKMLAGAIKPTEEGVKVPEMSISYKPQAISPSFDGTVEMLLRTKLRTAYVHPQFQQDVMKPLNMEPLMDRIVKNLSGGEIQRVAIALALGKPADVYLLDEPSAYLDAEQRLVTAKIIKRYLMNTKKTGFIVEHDFLMAIYLADRVVVYSGQPGIECTAHRPVGFLDGVNHFLQSIDVTFRRDPENFRPRINKHLSVKDRLQKQRGAFFTDFDLQDE